jgi:hypothetical protein
MLQPENGETITIPYVVECTVYGQSCNALPLNDSNLDDFVSLRHTEAWPVLGPYMDL